MRGDVVSFTYDFASRRATPQVEEVVVDLSRAAEVVKYSSIHSTARFAQDGELMKELLRGAPSNPIVYRIRLDVSWEDVCNSSTSTRHFVNGTYFSDFTSSI